MAEHLSISQTLAVEGSAIIRRYEPDASSIDAFARLGIVDTVEGLGSVQALIPHDLDKAPPNTYSGNFGTSDFPLHTDLAHWAVPPRYLALRCVRGSSMVATRLLDGQLLVKEFGTELLRMALVQPRRPMRNGKQLLRLLERTGAPEPCCIRWDSIYLKPATTLAKDVFTRVESFLSHIEPVEVVLLDRGDTLIIDNWRWLHGRSSITEGARSRHIDRAYLRFLL
jgi:L-asparagine oxygenase